MAEPTKILGESPHIINVGLTTFSHAVRAAGAGATDLDWRPPADGDRALGLLVAELADDTEDPLGSRIASANAEAMGLVLATRPRLIDVRPAQEVVPGLTDRMILHAGPPIDWADMCGPMRGAVIGAILLESWASTPAAAENLAATGEIRMEPCHHHSAVGPMAGVLSPSMPVSVVEDEASGRRAFASLNEGLGKVLRYGAFDEEVMTRLRWMGDVLGPALSDTLRAGDSIDLRAITGQALQMGDECHNRNIASTSLLARQLAPRMVRATHVDRAAEVLGFLRDNDHFFLNLSMAACKLAMDAAAGIPASTLVTAMARNGVEFGLRISGMGDEWFTAPVSVADGLYFPGYGPDDANPDMGDSSITETFGIGGFAMAGAPSIARFVGGTPAQAVGYTREMGRITLTKNNGLTLPPLDFEGVPTGIDVRRVVETRVAPVINTGIAHREAGVGQIGAGIARAPLACFDQALRRLAETLRSEDQT